MIQQLRYEGSRLDDVLAQIHTDHGDDVTIISAELMRSGGVAGFFSRETYEVTVELMDPLPETARAVPDDEPLASSTGGQRFADLLASMIEDRVELTPSGVTDGEPESVQQPEPEPAVAQEVPVPRVAPPTPVAPAVPAAPAILPYEFEEIDRVDLTSRPSISAPTRRVPLLPASHTEATGPAVSTSGRKSAVGGSSPRATESVEPESDALVGPGPRSIAAIIDAVSTWFRPAPPTPAEGLITVIGGRTESARVALALAARMGQTANDVLIAELGESDVSAEQMAELVTEAVWQRRSRNVAPVSIVVVVVAPGLEGHRWATRVLDGLNSNQIRLAIGGWRPLDRLEQTIAGLGRVDAIDLVDSDAVADPGQLLALPVPVATIDERPATAALWGGLLAATPASGPLDPPAAGPASIPTRCSVPPMSELDHRAVGIDPALATLR